MTTNCYSESAEVLKSNVRVLAKIIFISLFISRAWRPGGVHIKARAALKGHPPIFFPQPTCSRLQNGAAGGPENGEDTRGEKTRRYERRRYETRGEEIKNYSKSTRDRSLLLQN